MIFGEWYRSDVWKDLMDHYQITRQLESERQALVREQIRMLIDYAAPPGPPSSSSARATLGNVARSCGGGCSGTPLPIRGLPGICPRTTPERSASCPTIRFFPLSSARRSGQGRSTGASSTSTWFPSIIRRGYGSIPTTRTALSSFGILSPRRSGREPRVTGRPTSGIHRTARHRPGTHQSRSRNTVTEEAFRGGWPPVRVNEPPSPKRPLARVSFLATQKTSERL